jgi:hypothetical protein
MPSTFPRVTSVSVDTTFNQSGTGLYPDASLQSGGGSVAAVVPLIGNTASYGQLWRGMIAAISPTTGKLVPPNASGAVPIGVLYDEVSAYLIASGRKIGYIKKGRVRTYAGGNMTVGDLAKADTSANFCGVVKWVDGTDDPDLIVGRVAPLDDGSTSNGATAATAMVQGDTIFLDADFK